MTNAESRWSAGAGSLGRAMGAGLAMALVAALVLLGCGGAPKIHYYTLRFPSPSPPADSKTSYIVGVERFRAPDVLRDDRILYFESPTQLNFYSYHRWSQDPGALVAELAARRLDSMDVFSQVRLFPSREPSDYLLKGRLLSFEEVDYEGAVKGRVGLELALVRTSDQKIVWSDTRQSERAAEGKGVEGVVNALNRSTAELLDQVLPGLAAEVERQFKESPGRSK